MATRHRALTCAARVVDGDRILLVREKSDGLWALPAGFADVGLSAAQNVEKEILEEAGLKVSACRLYGVRHKASASYPPDVRDFYKMFFLCSRLSGGNVQPKLETSEARFFLRGKLPPLSLGRTIENDVESSFAFALDAGRPAFFD